MPPHSILGGGGPRPPEGTSDTRDVDLDSRFRNPNLRPPRPFRSPLRNLMRTKIASLLPDLLTGLLLLASCSHGESPRTTASSSRPSSPQSIVVWWFQWAPADGLAELGKDFEGETGIAVNVDQIPLSSYQDKTFLEFGSMRTRFDIVIGDSQWIGRGATKGLYVDLTDW